MVLLGIGPNAGKANGTGGEIIGPGGHAMLVDRREGQRDRVGGRIRDGHARLNLGGQGEGLVLHIERGMGGEDGYEVQHCLRPIALGGEQRQ